MHHLPRSESKQSLTLLEQLRLRTRDEHASIEKCIPVFDNDFSLDDYHHLLRALLAFYQPYEEGLQGLNHLLPKELELGSRLKTQRLIEDLGEPIQPVAIGLTLPSIERVSEALGALYVTEGSTLGGQVIFRHIRKRFGNAAGGLHFFGSYGEKTGEMWMKFKVTAETYVPPHEYERAIHSAKSTFRFLNQWLKYALGRRRLASDEPSTNIGDSSESDAAAHQLESPVQT